MTAETPKAILEWLKQKLSENKVGPLEIKYYLEPGCNIDNIFALAEGLH